MAAPEQQAVTPLPVHISTSAEANAHLVQGISADGTMKVKDSTTGRITTMRLAVLGVSGQLGMIAVGDP